MREASEEFGWNLDLGKISLGWRGGCIIRAKFLHRIAEAFEREILNSPTSYWIPISEA